MKIRTVIGMTAALAIAAGVWLLTRQSAEQRIRRDLQRLADLASVQHPESGWRRLSKSRQLAGYFATNVALKLDFDRYHANETTSERELFRQIVMARARLPELHVRVLDIRIQVAPSKTEALAHFTVLIEADGSDSVEAMELRAAWHKTGSGWKITRLETIRTLR